MPTKICAACKIEKDFNDFYTHKSGKPKSYCKSCTQKINRRWRDANVERMRKYMREWERNSRKVRREHHLERELKCRTNKYGKTPEWYRQKHAEQNGLCAICHLAETQKHKSYGTIMALAIDHNHATGKVRGLLCSQCNRTLTRCEAIPNWMENAAIYLAQY